MPDSTTTPPPVTDELGLDPAMQAALRKYLTGKRHIGTGGNSSGRMKLKPAKLAAACTEEAARLEAEAASMDAAANNLRLQARHLRVWANRHGTKRPTPTPENFGE